MNEWSKKEDILIEYLEGCKAYIARGGGPLNWLLAYEWLNSVGPINNVCHKDVFSFLSFYEANTSPMSAARLLVQWSNEDGRRSQIVYTVIANYITGIHSDYAYLFFKELLKELKHIVRWVYLGDLRLTSYNKLNTILTSYEDQIN